MTVFITRSAQPGCILCITCWAFWVGLTC